MPNAFRLYLTIGTKPIAGKYYRAIGHPFFGAEYFGAIFFGAGKYGAIFCGTG